MTVIEHGTYGGYQRCIHQPDGPCQECRQANRRYVKQWREHNTDRHARHVRKARARDKALRALARRYPAEFAELYDQELAELGGGVVTRPARSITLASLPRLCAVCSGDRHILQAEIGSDGGRMVPCPHCAQERPIPICVYRMRVDRPRETT